MPPRFLILPPPGAWPRVPCAPQPNAAPACSVSSVPRLIARMIRGRKIVSGAELNPVSLCRVNHALHQTDFLSPPRPACAAFREAGLAVRSLSLVPGSPLRRCETSHGAASQQENVPNFETHCLRKRSCALKSPQKDRLHQRFDPLWHRFVGFLCRCHCPGPPPEQHLSR